MMKRVVFILFLIFNLNGEALRLLEENLKVYQVIYPKKYPLKEKVPVIIAVAPERDVDFFLGKWNEFVGDDFISNSSSCVGVFAADLHLTKGPNLKRKKNSHWHCTYYTYFSPYALIPKENRKFEIKLNFRTNLFKKSIKKVINWEAPYWFRIKLLQDMLILMKINLPISSGGIDLKNFEINIDGIVEKYEDPMHICEIMDIKEEVDKGDDHSISFMRVRKLEIDGKCVKIREELNKSGEIEKIRIEKILPPQECRCIPEVARLYSGVVLKWKGSLKLPVKIGKRKFSFKKLWEVNSKRKSFFKNWKLVAKGKEGKIQITLFKRTGPPQKVFYEVRTWFPEQLWEKEPRAMPSRIKSNSAIPPQSIRDFLMEVELIGKNKKKKALVYLYQLGSPKGGKRLTWFDWAEVIEGEGKIELCNGDVAPALMFEDKECGKASLEFCLKTEEEIKAIKITRIRASNYAGEVWEEKVALSAKIVGGE